MVHVSTAAAEPPVPGLLEALTLGIAVVGRRDGALCYLNAAAEDLLGVSRQRVRGLPLAAVADFGADWQRRIEQAAAAGQGFTARALTLVLAANGRRLTVDAAVIPTRTSDGTDCFVIELAGTDRQRRIEREESLRAQEQANRALLRGLAHEIRNPLAGLRGAAQLLERELGDSALTGHTDIIVREADRLRALVERMVGPARPLALDRINIHEVTEHVAALLRSEGGDNVEVATEYDPSIPELDADRDRLVQAALNLGRNALQAVGPGGRVTLRTSTRRQFTIGAQLHRLVVAVEVIDDGPGIPAAIADVLFQPMISGRAEGSGLGLTIAQTLVGQHGGLVECESEAGHTLFRMLLPLAPPGSE